MPSLIIAGAHVLCYINGRLYSQVSGLQWDSGTPKKEIYGIDSPEPFELAPTVGRLSGRLSLFRVVGDGGLQGPGIASRYIDLPAQKYFRLQLVERRGSTVIFEAEFCTVESESWSVPAKGLVTGTMNFKAINWANEVKPVQ